MRDTEQIPLLEDGGIEAFLEREVLPYTQDAWYEPGNVVTSWGPSTGIMTACPPKSQAELPLKQVWMLVAEELDE